MPDNVSILTRPEGRVLRDALVPRRRAYRFQSSPGPKAGCYAEQDDHPILPHRSFNPHPARRPGATR